MVGEEKEGSPQNIEFFAASRGHEFMIGRTIPKGLAGKVLLALLGNL